MQGTSKMWAASRALCSGTRLHGVISHKTALYHNSFFTYSSWKKKLIDKKKKKDKMKT
jgi:hypothetical protein